MEQRTPEWHKARSGRITASIVGAILGRDPYRTRDDVMRQMVREHHGANREFNGNIATEYGVAHEDGAIAEFEIETGLTVDRIGFIARVDWAGCSPDGLIGDDAGIEVKCPFGKRKDEKPSHKSLEEQPQYHDQVQFSLWVTGRPRWYFYQWAPGGTAMEIVEPCPEWREECLPKLRAFHDEYLEEIKSPDKHLKPKRVTVDTVRAHAIVREYDEITESLDRLTERKKELLDDMVRLSGSRDAIFAGRKLTLVERTGSVSYAKALAKYAPDADLEPFRGKPSTSWRLT